MSFLEVGIYARMGAYRGVHLGHFDGFFYEIIIFGYRDGQG
ncbi:hypothetical protein [Desulfopila inferna]|nr:hypothetical protein [Desulfopila inferna]